MDRYNNYQTKQLHERTHTYTHNNRWLVFGWVTTKEYHPHLCIDYVDSMARYKCNYTYIWPMERYTTYEINHVLMSHVQIIWSSAK